MPTPPHTPPSTSDLSAALRQLERYLTHAGHTIAAHSALGHLLAGNHTAARIALERLPASYLDQLVPVAQQLADLARHVASLEDRT